MMSVSMKDVAHDARKEFVQEFEVHGVFVTGYAERGGISLDGRTTVSLMFERANGWGKGRDSEGFTLANFQRLDAFETRMAIARQAYRTLRKMAAQPDLGPEALPSPAVTAWATRVCEEICK